MDLGASQGYGGATDTAALQAALDQCPPGGTVVCPARGETYALTAALRITKPLTFDGQQSELQHTRPGTPGLVVTASRVTVRRLRLTGVQHTAPAALQEAGIRVAGASAADPVTDLTIEGCALRNWGDAGVLLDWVTDFRVVGNTIRDIGYAGILGTSVQRGVISQNHITHLTGTVVTNAYGIAVTRQGQASLTLYPRSSDVVISDNVVRDVAGWEGIDAHAGQRLTIRGNVVRHCRLGISVGSSVVGGVETYASIDCAIVGNVVDSEVTDGSAGYPGIQLLGAGVTAGTPVELATGAIVGNVVRGCGGAAVAPGVGGIMVRNTRGVPISGNTVIEPAPIGINAWYNNYDVAIVGNTIVDVFADDTIVNQAVGIFLRDGANRGLVTGNVLVRGTKTITAGFTAFAVGIRASATAPVLPWVLGVNQITGQTGAAVVDAGGTVLAAQPLLATGTGRTVDQVVTTLQTLGLVRQT